MDAVAEGEMATLGAIEVERVSDDPPERVQAWVTTVSESALAQLDLEMLLDLLRIEEEATPWEHLSTIAASEVERRTLTLTTLLEPILILIMGAIVLMIVLAVLLPIIEINQLVK